MKGFLVGQRMTMILFATHSQAAQWWIDVNVFKKLKAGETDNWEGGWD